MDHTSPFHEVLLLQTKNAIRRQRTFLNLVESGRQKTDNPESNASTDFWIATLEEWLDASERHLAELQAEKA